ncbi:AgmX/PglI C-terminal domain-containing protein [Bdellovibrio sp. HCB2-146]|uniref:AgmX/PglI C-terminal domain-containing protein n=1 Tax=Bdellovibrio sp. HCB2-146 TaxID=3394362 RepID=UPI0039BC3514
MAKNNKIILSLIGIGLLSLALSLFISTQTEKQTPGLQSIARAQLNLGKVFVLRKNLTKKELLTRRTSIFPQDSVETGVDGDATLEFDSGDRLHLQENTLVTLDNENDRIVVIVKRGDLQMENQGREGFVFISRDGKRWSPAEYEASKKQVSDSLPDVAPATGETQPQATSTIGSGLSPEFIQDVLRTHRPSFFRCYTQLLQKTPGVVGTVSISFTIERTGKVSQADISSTTFADTSFKKCLIEAVRRVEFKSFDGAPIATTFPIRFE